MEKLFSCKTASEFFSYSQGYFRRLIDKNLISYEKQGSNVRFKESVLIKHFEDKAIIEDTKMQVSINKNTSNEIIKAIEQMKINDEMIKNFFASFQTLISTKEKLKKEKTTKWKFANETHKSLQKFYYGSSSNGLAITNVTIDTDSYIQAIENGKTLASYKLVIFLLNHYIKDINEAFSREKYQAKKKEQNINFTQTINAIEQLEIQLKKGFKNV